MHGYSPTINSLKQSKILLWSLAIFSWFWVLYFFFQASSETGTREIILCILCKL